MLARTKDRTLEEIAAIRGLDIPDTPTVAKGCIGVAHRGIKFTTRDEPIRVEDEWIRIHALIVQDSPNRSVSEMLIPQAVENFTMN